MRASKYSDQEVENDIRSFFQNPDHWAYQYGTPSMCNPEFPYYKRQLEVLFEDRYFHWLTHRIINELVTDEFLIQVTEELFPNVRIDFVYRSDLRYHLKKMYRALKWVKWYSRPDVNEFRGKWCELLTERMFERLRFDVVDRNTNEFNNKVWDETNHNLDFIVTKDGIPYGVEVKNTLSYMDKDEFDIKLDICKHLGIIPLWVLRHAPYSQFRQIWQVDGFILTFKAQLYPITYRAEIKEIWEILRLPVAIWERFPEKFEERVLKRHEKVLKERS